MNLEQRKCMQELRGHYGKAYNQGLEGAFGGFTAGGHYEDKRRWAASAECIIDRFRPSNVIELGCGRGTLTDELRARGVQACGFDLGEDVRTKWGAVGNAVELPFRGKFDVVLALDILEHIPDDCQELLFRELRRITGRTLLLTVPTIRPYYRLDSFAGPVHHYLSLSPLGWAQHFKDHGFHVVASGDDLESLGPPFNHGSDNFPFHLSPRPRES